MKKPPQIVEIIGLAGTGKSTLSSGLYRQNNKFLASERLGGNNTKHRLFYMEQAFLLLPTFIRRPRNGRRFARGDIKKMVYLNGWHRVLKRQGSNNNAIIVLDQGAIYKLATLYGFGPEKLKDQRLNVWWDQLFEQWASTLDMVVWLDGPDDILIDRINSRDSWHLVKELSNQEARKYFSEYRLAYNYILSKLISVEDITVLRFDTSYKSPEDIMAQVLSSIDGTDCE
jgi:deoxyadenosine/deoxycytidine kinase